MRNSDFTGLNVTIPYKKDVMPFLDEVDDLARRLGSVNTIVKRSDGTLYGDNTDIDGFTWLLERNGGIEKGQKALVLGSGGASLTVQAVLEKKGAECVVVSRNGENNYVNYHKHADATLLVNASPVGMYPNNVECLIDLSLLPNLKCVVRYGVGVDNVDIPAATRHGVAVCNVPDYSVHEVAAHAFAMMLALTRKLKLMEYINILKEI